jgi:hypothetical protein
MSKCWNVDARTTVQVAKPNLLGAADGSQGAVQEGHGQGLKSIGQAEAAPVRRGCQGHTPDNHRRFGMDDCGPQMTPLDQGTFQNKHTQAEEEDRKIGHFSFLLALPK